MIYTIPSAKGIQTINRTCFEPPREGAECMFIKLNAKEGVKIYPTLSTAKFAYNRQRQAYKFGVAPEVLSKIQKCLVGNLLEFDRQDVFLSDSGVPRVHGYFYITEVARLVQRFNWLSGKESKEAEKLGTILKSLKFNTRDIMRTANLGRIRGRLVAIDFGKMSTWQISS